MLFLVLAALYSAIVLTLHIRTNRRIKHLNDVIENKLKQEHSTGPTSGGKSTR